MKNSRLIELFLQLSSRDMREFGKFVRSPYFNQREDLARFWDCLVEYSEELGVIPGKKKVFARVYPDRDYRDQDMRLLMSYLHRLILQFIGYSKLLEEETLIALKQASGLRERGLPGRARKTLQKLEAKLQRGEKRNAPYFLNNYLLQLENYGFISADQPTGKLNFQEMSDTIDLAYLTEKLRQSCLLLSHQAVYQSDYQVGFLQEVIHYVEDKSLLNVPAIAVYYYCYLMLTRPEEEASFANFKNLLFANGQRFAATELRDLYLLAVNYCVRQANEGRQQYLNEIMDLYREGLQTGSLLENGMLSRFTYHNIAGAGLKTREYEWVEQFIHEYRSSLEKKYRDSSFNFNLARLEYSRQRYDRALPLLQKSNYRDLLLNLAAKTLLLKIYYELDEFDLLQAHLDAMKSFIGRKRVIGYHRTNYLNIIRFTKKLLRLNPFDREEIQNLRTAIAAEEVLTEREWLLRRLQIV